MSFMLQQKQQLKNVLYFNSEWGKTLCMLRVQHMFQACATLQKKITSTVSAILYGIHTKLNNLLKIFAFNLTRQCNKQFQKKIYPWQFQYALQRYAKEIKLRYKYIYI